jgi:hypothetical protein
MPVFIMPKQDYAKAYITPIHIQHQGVNYSKTYIMAKNILCQTLYYVKAYINGN